MKASQKRIKQNEDNQKRNHKNAMDKFGTILKREPFKKLKGEVWRTLSDPQFEGLYEVSNYGRVKSWRGRGHRRITPLLLIGGIYRREGSFRPNRFVLLYNQEGKKINRKIAYLVLTEFVGLKPLGKMVMYLDCDPLNCRLDNLAWATFQEVVDHQSDTPVKWTTDRVKELIKTHRSKELN